MKYYDVVLLVAAYYRHNIFDLCSIDFVRAFYPLYSIKYNNLKWFKDLIHVPCIDVGGKIWLFPLVMPCGTNDTGVCHQSSLSQWIVA